MCISIQGFLYFVKVGHYLNLTHTTFLCYSIFMKRLAASLLLTLSLLCTVVAPVHFARAYDLNFDPTTGTTTTPLKTYSKLGSADPAYIVFTIVNTALLFLGMVTVILIIVAGFMWLLAGGAEEPITKAKAILKGAIIGLVIVMASYGLAQYLFTAIQQATTGS